MLFLRTLQKGNPIRTELDLTQPIFDLARFKFLQVLLVQDAPHDADEALNRYLDQHVVVFEVLQAWQTQLEKLYPRFRDGLQFLLTTAMMGILGGVAWHWVQLPEVTPTMQTALR